MERRHVVMITSVIDFVHKELSYHHIRSIYSPAQRIQQTKRTISSIKKHIPWASIVLLEWWLRNYRHEFWTSIDRYVFLGDRQLIKKCVDSSNKSLWEAMILIYGLQCIDLARWDILWKISGRYVLNTSFDITKFDTKKYSFRKIHSTLSTKLYCLWYPAKIKHMILLICTLPLLLLWKSIEASFAFVLPTRLYTCVDVLWVQWHAWPIWTFYIE